jgi:hypothetical protein
VIPFLQVAILAQSCDRVSEIARQYQAGTNALNEENQILRCNLANLSNDNESDSNKSHDSVVHRSKRQRTRYLTPDDNDGEILDDTQNQCEDEFVNGIGHKFSIIHALWVHNGADIFKAKVDDTYDITKRFENDNNKRQGQLQEIIGLLKEQLNPDVVLHQKWVRREV